MSVSIGTGPGEQDVGPALELLGWEGEVTGLHREAVRVATAQSGLTPAEQAQVAGSAAAKDALEGWRSAAARERSVTAYYSGWDPGGPDWEERETEVGAAFELLGEAARRLDQVVAEATGREDAGENLRAMVDLSGPLLEQAGDPLLRGELHVERALGEGMSRAWERERVTGLNRLDAGLAAEGDRHVAEARRVLASGPGADQVLGVLRDLAAHPWSQEWSGREEMDTPLVAELGRAVADTGIHPDPGMLARMRMRMEQDPTYTETRARYGTLLPLDQDAPATTGSAPSPPELRRLVDELPAPAELPEQVGLRGDTIVTWYPDVGRVRWSVEGWPGEHVTQAAQFEEEFTAAWEAHREAMEAGTRLVGPQVEAVRQVLEDIRPPGTGMDSVFDWDPATRSLEVSTGPEFTSERVYMVVGQDLAVRITDPGTGQVVEPATARARLLEAAPPVEPAGPELDPDGDWDPRFDLGADLRRGMRERGLPGPGAVDTQPGPPAVGQGQVPTTGPWPQVGQHQRSAVVGQEPGMRI